MVRLYSILSASLLRTGRPSVTLLQAARRRSALLSLSLPPPPATASPSTALQRVRCDRRPPCLQQCSASLLEWSALFPAPLRRPDPLLCERAEKGRGDGEGSEEGGEAGDGGRQEGPGRGGGR